MLCSFIKFYMIQFLFQTAQKNPATLGSSLRQFENSNDFNICCNCLIDKLFGSLLVFWFQLEPSSENN